MYQLISKRTYPRTATQWVSHYLTLVEAMEAGQSIRETNDAMEYEIRSLDGDVMERWSKDAGLRRNYCGKLQVSKDTRI